MPEFVIKPHSFVFIYFVIFFLFFNQVILGEQFQEKDVSSYN